METTVISERHIENIAKEFLDDSYKVTRFTTGLCHYVFYVEGKQSRFVVRVCRPGNENKLKGSVFWTNELKQRNLPVANILKSSIGIENHSYLILEYLDGVDLGKIVDDLSKEEQENIVDTLVSFDAVANSFQMGDGYGWGTSYSCPQLLRNWPEVIDGIIQRAEDWIADVGKVDLAIIKSIKFFQAKFGKYLESVEPKAYFHDLTTKNLLISPKSHKIFGFVDVDEMGFGDNIFHISLMKMALFANDHSNSIVDLWLEKIDVSDQEKDVLMFYTLLHCATFMGENGKVFNKGAASFDEEYHYKLSSYFDELISYLK